MPRSLDKCFKYAEATETIICIKQSPGSLFLKISDNGKGIISDKMENPFSMGLLGMRERARIIGPILKY